MRKLVFTVIILTLSLALRTWGQTQLRIRGDSILASTNVQGGIGPGDAKTNSASGAPARIADGALVGFDKLSGFLMPLNDDLLYSTNLAANTQVTGMIPADIRALDSRKLTVEGFMMPMEFEKDKTIEFMLVQAPFGCCFGTPPQIHELIKVRVKSPGVSPIMDGPARARGIFHVGAERESGLLSSIYRMDAESVTAKP